MDFSPKKKYQNIPFELCKYVLLKRRKMITPFNIYLCLSMNCSGKIILDSKIITELSNSLGLNEKTFKNSIETLKNENWIGYNLKNNQTYIRGFNTLLNNFELKSNVKTEVSYIELNKKYFKKWLQSVVICRTITNANFNRHRNKRIEQKDANKSSITHLKGVNLEYLKKVLGVPISTLSLWILNGNKHGYLTRELQYSTVWKSSLPNVSKIEFNAYLKSHKENFGKCFIKNNQIIKKEANIYQIHMKFFNTKKKKLGVYKCNTKAPMRYKK